MLEFATLSPNGARTRHPLLLKLNGALPEEDRSGLISLFSKTRRVGMREDIVREGDGQSNVHLLLEGKACRYKVMPGGGRAILAYLVPGDLCELQHVILGKMDHSIAALTPCLLAEALRTDIDELSLNRPAVGRALWRTTLVDEAVLRAWLSRLSQMPADKSLAGLICELWYRLDVVGLVENGTRFRLAVTQEEIGDMLGVTAVHVNRLMQQLREAGLVQMSGKSLTVPDLHRLELFAEFDPGYLHLNNMAAIEP